MIDRELLLEWGELLGFDTYFFVSLGRRTYRIRHKNRFYVLKFATGEGGNLRLNHEYSFLKKHDCLFTPAVHQYQCLNDMSVLVLSYYEGLSLDISTYTLQMVAQMRQCIKSLHISGFVHCDLCPDHIVFTKGGIIILDWEYVAPVNKSISKLPQRPYNSGWTHPNLIWEKGNICPNIDLYFFKRLDELRYSTVV